MAVTAEYTPLAIYGNDDAGFRIWAEAWHDAVTALGCTQVYSNIDFTTATISATSGVLTGGRVYQLDDDLHATSPVFFKLEWGRGNGYGVNNGFKMQVTVGEAHSSGTLSGNVFTHYVTAPRLITEIGEIISVRSDAGILLATNNVHSLCGQDGFMLERTRVDGVPVADGLGFLLFGSDVNDTSGTTSDSVAQAVDYIMGTVYMSNGGFGLGFDAPCFVSPTVSPAANGKTPVFPIALFGGYDPLRMVIGVSSTALGYNTRFAATVNGETGNYRTVTKPPYSIFGTGNIMAFLEGE